MANNGDSFGRVSIALEDCLEDRASFKNKVPMRSVDGVFAVKVILGESTFGFFVLVSGASDVFISPSMAEELKAPGTLSQSNALGPQSYVLAIGSEIFAQRYILDSLRIGNTELSGIVVAVNENEEGMLLLGQSVLKKLGRYSIDYQRHRKR